MARNYGGICHKWAAQNKPSGKNGNIFFEGSRIWSYGHHYLMANFVRPNVVLINSYSYSVSTSQHRRAVYDALQGLDVSVFEVPYPAPLGAYDHEQNIQHFVSEYNTSLLTASRARQNRVYALDSARCARGLAIRYAETFGIEFTPPPKVDEAMMQAARAANETARKEKAESDRIAREQRIAAIADQIPKWRSGEQSSLPYDHGITLLRVKGNIIETSRGARVPLDVAPWLWVAIIKARAGRPFEQLNGTRVGDFTLRQIDQEGNVTIGCHVLLYPELERLAKELGLCISNSETTFSAATTSENSLTS